MKEKIQRDRQLLIIFCLIWVISSLWIIHNKSLIINQDLAKLPTNQAILIFIVSFSGLVSFIFASAYVHKMYTWYNSPRLTAKMMTTLFVVSSLIVGLVSILIVAGVLWKTKDLVKEKGEEKESIDKI